MAKVFACPFVGFFISFLVTAILTGGVQNALGLLLASIVCTAGVGLVFWIPVWWLVGAIALSCFSLMDTGNPERKPEPVPNPMDLPNVYALALKAYFSKAVASGMKPDEMMRQLQDNGWKKADIERAYALFISAGSTT
jgi:biotin transporter BioY